MTMLLRSFSSAALAFALTGAAVPQTPPRRLQDPLLVALGKPWDPATQGPLLMVVPLQTKPGAPLKERGLEIVPVGGLSALVPTTMVLVDSRPPDSPNLYEGLPQEAKVMYLARSFDAGQWAKATGAGIGRDDLHGEQAAVFESILPNPVRYTLGKISDENGRHGLQGLPGEHTLSNADRARITLRIVRELRMEIALKNGGTTAGELPEDEKPGTVMPYLQETKDAEFGRTVLVTVPTAPRKGDLDLRDPRLSSALPLVPQEGVKALFARVAAATGLRLVADPHYAIRQVVERGTGASARDLLGAVSLGLGATFRRVGDAYVLTNDLVGMAAHRARIAVWEDALKKEVARRQATWRREIAKGPGFRQIRFHGALADALTPDEQTNLEANDGPGGGPHFIPVGQTDRTVQNALRTLQNGLDVDREKVGISSNVRYEIVLPGLGRGWWRGWLDSVDQYLREPSADAPPTPKAVALPLDPKGAVTALVLRADSPSDARRRVAQVAGRGVGTLLLETWSLEALAAAVAAGREAGVKVGLALRPWSLAPGERTADPDRTATGEHGVALTATKRDLGSLPRYFAEIAAYDPPVPERLGPLDPAIPAHLAAARALAAVPGLTETALLDLYPPGYGREESRSSGSYWYSPALDAYLAYGYTEAQRAAYLREMNVDPLDLEGDMGRLEVELGPAWGQSYGYGESRAAWQKAKGAASHARALALAQALRAAAPAVPLLLPGEPPQTQLPPAPAAYLAPYEGGDALPAAPVDYDGDAPPAGTALRTVVLLDDPDPLQRARVADRLRTAIEKGGPPLALDLTAVPSKRLDAVLGGWLKGREAP